MWSQTPETITKTNYTVTGNETLTASQSIIIQPNSLIQQGSTFVAKIDSDAYTALTFSTENYIFSRNYQKAIKNSSDITSNKDIIDNVVYYDGLGRAMQNIAIKASPLYKDIITHVGYDSFGRQEKEYLPYMEATGSVGTYRNSADLNTNNYYIANYPLDINSGTPNPFSKKKFDDSPLNRVLQQAAPGQDWALGSGHEVKTDYQTNVANEVKLYIVSLSLANNTYTPTLTLSTANGGYYAAGQLYKTIAKNENWTAGNNNTSEEFKDKQGHVILKKNYGVSVVNNVQINTTHETYYIYDNYGNLTYVLPPKADGNITSLNDLCYQYKYDIKNRLVEKKLPGKDWEYIVYDKLDRPVLTQDANLRANNKWLFTKYDLLNRPVYTGIYTDNANTTRATVQTAANNSTAQFETRTTVATIIGTANANYTNTAFPDGTLLNTAIDLFAINYYDNYANIDLDGGIAANAVSYGVVPITNAKGLSTCSKVRVLETNDWITNVLYYDIKGRPVYKYSKNNYLTVTAIEKIQLDFVGKVLETTSTHKKGNDALITIIYIYSYDHGGRLLIQKQTINNQAQEVLVSNTYDNLGQLLSKGVGGKTTQPRLQNVDYSYNIRGWLKKINDVNSIGNDLFAFQINYNNPTSGIALYNGNISQTFWRTVNTDNSLKNYTYSYDDLNRLTLAADNSALNPGRYNEGLSYDKNGNIINVMRLGHTNFAATTFGTMDNLTYTYDAGNKLTKVEDVSGSTEGFNNASNTAIEYTYDGNGNMKTDSNKGITAVTYNYLNLPTAVTLSGNTINYVYDATGIKQRKTISTGGSTDYAGGFVYEDNNLKQFSQSEGYVAYSAGAFNYIYQYKDHLGNNRLSYQDKDNNGLINTTEIVQENNYYAFGLTQKGYNSVVNGVDNKYKYNGKEVQNELGLNMYDFGARNYDPALGRWMNIDPLAEKFTALSTYNYAMNNPVYFIDPDGMDVVNSYGFRSEVSNGMSFDNEYDVDLNTGAVTYVSNRGGDTTDYLNFKKGNGETLYTHEVAVQHNTETIQNGSEIGRTVTSRQPGEALTTIIKPTSGTITPLEFSSPAFTWGWALKGLGYAWNSLVGSAVTAEASASVSTGGNVLRHYTSESGYQAIMESGELLSSVGAKNARHGSGQYFTDLMAGDLTSGQVSRRLFGVPWNSNKLTNFIDVDLSGLKVIENTSNNFLVPNTASLSLQGRIINHGVSIFKE